MANIIGEENTIKTSGGEAYQYDWLVVCPGLVLRYDKIEGAAAALDDPSSPVGSIYRLDYAYKAS